MEQQYKIENNGSFVLKHIFECGQCFRWNEELDGSYTGVFKNNVLNVKEQNHQIIFDGICDGDIKEIVTKYFDLERDYDEIKKQLSKIDEPLKNSIDYGSGIRLLNQDLWETTISFIVSANNNIPRIKGIISRMCEEFGKEICDGIYSFPSADALSKLSEDDLKPLRSGFRAGYILDAAKKVAGKEIDLESIKNMDIVSARLELQQIKGVGPKVAECTLLYGFHRLEAFPMDVWMKRAMKELFAGMIPEDFGRYAGIAQQYIFNYSRTNPELVKNKIS